MVQHYLIQYGDTLIFLGTIAEGGGTLLAAFFLARRGYFRLVVVVALAAASTTLANQFHFRISRTHNKALLQRKALQRASQPRAGHDEAYFSRGQSGMLSCN